MRSPNRAALLWLLLYGLPLIGAIKEPCRFQESELDAVCSPCPKTEWLNMVKPATGDEEIMNAEKTCFNNDPIKIPRTTKPTERPTLVSVGEYRITPNHGPQGYFPRKQPFLRYAYVEDQGSSATKNIEEYLDLDEVKKYYNRKDQAGNTMDADFQLLEWPGATSEGMHARLNPNIEDSASRCDKTNVNQMSCKLTRQWMLNFERDNGKILNYPCNAGDGTHIVAAAAISKTNLSTMNPFIESAQKIWLTHGNKTFFSSYIHPLYVPQYILEKMGKSEGSLCRNEEVDCESSNHVQSQFCTERCKLLYNKTCVHVRSPPKTKVGKLPYMFGDLRTVMDFTFTRNRLVLGMKCGILVVSGLHSDRITFTPSYLQSETELGHNLFPGPINRISASTCCLSVINCGPGGGLVAAYSFDKLRQADQDKFLYVSFDNGDTFVKKIVATSYSPINLIKGLYKMYNTWHDYYEILNNPDKHDLDDDDELLKNLRSKPFWYTSTSEEKEKLFSIGTRAGKKKATLKKIVEILDERVPKRIKRLGRGENKDLTPAWANKIFHERRKRFNWSDSWTDENCDMYPKCQEGFENDRAVNWLLKNADIHVKTPRRNENEPFCKEITSMFALPEEKQIIALCLIGYDKVQVNNGSSTTPNKTGEQPFGLYAIYNFPIKENLPLIFGYRISQRILTCKYIINTMNPNKTFIVQPEIVRVQGTATILVLNCDGVIYMSTNFGNTIFSTAFYYQNETIGEFCANDGNYTVTPKDSGTCPHEKNGTLETAHYFRAFRLCALNVPPMFATDSSGYIFLITFGKFYAFGSIAYNRETRLVVGQVLPKLEYDDRFENLLFPAVDKDGEAVLTIDLARAYSIPPSVFKNKLYQKKHALRLVQMPNPFHREARNFYAGNLAMCRRAHQKKYGFPLCRTFSYSVYPQQLDMDVGDQESVQVTVQDADPFLPLWIYSSNENSVEVNAYHSLREGSPVPKINMHNWKIDIKTKANQKIESEAESQVDAFFGSDYNKFNEYFTQISIVHRPNIRCHVRPAATVDIQIGCNGKKLVAHEDKYRPQCKLFRRQFNYTIRRGRYDPDLANSWIQTSSNRSRVFFKINLDGDLIVTYNYVDWGCPVEPFRADHWIPDLRVVDENTEDTSKGVPFKGSFILFEVLGTKGFSYTKKAKDMNCVREPQNLREMKKRWIYRQRLFHIASERLKFPKTVSELKTLDYSSGIQGNRILKNNAVWKHANIWNQANYVPCHATDPDASPSDLPTHIANLPYEIMKARPINDANDDNDEEDAAPKQKTIEELEAGELRKDTGYLEEGDDEEEEEEDEPDDTLNEIMWHKDHPRVLLFMAVAVDDHHSLCDFRALFGVSLKTIPEMNDLHSFLIFLFFLLFWVGLVVGGYRVRKRYLWKTFLDQAKAERLEQAAWTIVYRYEKLVHGNAMDAIFHTDGDASRDPALGKMNLAAKTAHDKRKADLRMKKNHIMAQEQARHERLQKLFQKQ